ncbi:MAG: hypothetical protein Q8R39_01885 [bacterium]|nr:hypothetical protein [bacterium]MDZ4284515.1 hypothetical protein [Patescibacteria group bacterium]
MIINVAKVFLPATIAFAIGVVFAPLLAHYLYRFRMWKKSAKAVALDGRGTPIFHSLHRDRETSTPKLGGIVIWGSTLVTVLLIRIAEDVIPSALTAKLEFLSRSQTWLPLVTLLVGATIGFIDDMLDVRGGGKYLAGGLSLRMRLGIVALTGLIGGWWFFTKLGVSSIIVPFAGEVILGWLLVPLFIIVLLAIYSGGVIDGIDGLAGGVFAAIFGAYGGIAFFQNQIDLAAFSAVVVGGILAFLWFNIPPARFYMSETGTMGLTMTLAVVAFLTKAVVVLPIIAFPLLATTASDVIQLASKRFRGGRKVFLIAPVHHHFEALGWPPYKVTMRYWVISVICALLGMIVALVGNQVTL